MTQQPPLASPCTSVCTMDQKTGFCLGCWRTGDEIAGWGSSDNREKLLILAQLNARREQNGGRKRRLTARAQVKSHRAG